MNSKWSLNLQCMQICIGPIERSPKGLLGLRLENGNSNVAQSVLLFFARVFLLPFHCELGHEYAEGSGFRYHFPFCRFPFRHGCNSPFVVQWNWIFLRSFLFDLHTDVYVDHTHLIGFEWQNRFACDLRIYCPGGKLILQAGDLPRSVISSDRAIAFYEVAHFVLVYWSYSHLSLPQIPRHRWQAMAS